MLNPFLSSVGHTLLTMLDLHPTRRAVTLGGMRKPGRMFTAVIGISGQWCGAIAMSFPPQTALGCTRRMLGAEFTGGDEQIIDAVAEITNVIAGSAKARFDCNPPLQLGLPTVVEGTGYNLKYPSKSVWLDVAFDSEAGDFVMEFTYIPR